MTVEPGDEISDIHFYNPGDKPPTKPYMSIFFKNLSPSDWENVEKWHKEMIEKLREMGRVHTKGDYEKITPVVTEYSAKFITTQADCIAIEFPKEKTGILLVNEKKVEK
ncbi:MAG: hypothetical protein QG568_49 [Patescibacteria group bacterium]|nr:hypothetical protein [Patescibacteria group bacterium]